MKRSGGSQNVRCTSKLNTYQAPTNNFAVLNQKMITLAKINLKHLDQYNKYDSLQLENKKSEAKLESKLPHPRSNNSDRHAKSTLKRLALYCYKELKVFVHA